MLSLGGWFAGLLGGGVGLAVSESRADSYTTPYTPFVPISDNQLSDYIKRAKRENLTLCEWSRKYKKGISLGIIQKALILGSKLTDKDISRYENKYERKSPVDPLNNMPKIIRDTDPLPVTDEVVEVDPLQAVAESKPEKKGSAIRPQSFDEFIGNKEVKAQLKMAVESAKIRNEVLDHVILYGEPGLGKTSLSYVLANSLGYQLIEITGETLKNQKDLYKLLFQIKQAQSTGNKILLVIDELHIVSKQKELHQEVWFPLLEDFKFHHSLKGEELKFNGDILQISSDVLYLEPFTVVGATTHSGLLSEPLRDRLSIQCWMQAYKVKDIKIILQNYCKKANFKYEPSALETIAKRARGVPRVAINLVKRCRDRFVVAKTDLLSLQIADEQMKAQNIDELGLKKEDYLILNALAKRPRGLGKKNLSAVTRIAEKDLENVYEPYLKHKGFMDVLQRRVITDDGMALLKEKANV